MNNMRGVLDLMKPKRYRPKDIADKMAELSVPGNWDIYQNVYNLVSGKIVPRDAYVYIVLANLLEVDVETVLYRYTSVTTTQQKNKIVADDLDW